MECQCWIASRRTSNLHRICKTRSERESQQIINKLLLIKFEPRFRFDKLMQLMHSNCTYIYKFNEANLINAWNIYYIYSSKERERERSIRILIIENLSSNLTLIWKTKHRCWIHPWELSWEHVARLCFATN